MYRRAMRMEGVPLDRVIRELLVLWERRDGEITGGERFLEILVQPMLHSKVRSNAVYKWAYNGPIVRAHIEFDKMTCNVVPRPATCGDGRV